MNRFLAVLAALALCAGAVALLVFRPREVPAPVEPARSTARLVSVGPRLTSNQTPQPLAVYGEGLEPGMRLALGAPLSRELPLKVVDGRHAYARLPADVVTPRSLERACGQVCGVADDIGSLFAGVYGGSTPFPVEAQTG